MNLMKKITLIIMTLFCANNTLFAQNNEIVKNSIDYFNGFQDTYTSKPDSALYFVRKLAEINKPSASDLIHNSFAQSFQYQFIEKSFQDPELLSYLQKKNVSLDQ